MDLKQSNDDVLKLYTVSFNLGKVVNDLMLNMNKKSTSVLFLLDHSVAFDTTLQS